MAPVVLRIQWKENNIKFRIELKKKILDMSLTHFQNLLSSISWGRLFWLSSHIPFSLTGNANSPGQMPLPQGDFLDPQALCPLQPSLIEFSIVLFHSTLKLSLIVPIMVPVLYLFMFLILCLFFTFVHKVHESWHHICFAHCCVSRAKCSVWHLEELNTVV